MLMKIYLSFTLFFLFAFVANAQTITNIKWLNRKAPNTSDTIYYNPLVKLQWPNFKGKPEVDASPIALTASGFGYAAFMNSKNGKTTINITVDCFFNKSKSWVKPNHTTAYVLSHEQLHFDITYIGSCLFITRLRDTTFTEDNYAGILNKIYIESLREMNKRQNEYDGQTKNGQLKNIQAEWKIKIEEELKKLNKLP
jgi:hypothetical protein